MAANATTSPRTPSANSSRSSSASGSRSSSNDTIVAPVRTAQPGDTCFQYKSSYSDECWRERSCEDCLNAPLLNGRLCQLDRYGFCSFYDNVSSAGQPGVDYFITSVHRYCAKTDPACQSCYQENSTSASSWNEWNWRVCIGANGRVCAARCASANGPRKHCPKPSTHDSGFSPYGVLFLAIGIVLSMAVFSLIRRFCFPQATGRQRRPRRRPRSSRVQLLALEGWQAMRRKLIDQEHSALGLTAAETTQDNDRDDTGPSITVEYGPTTHPMEQTRSTPIER